jgi:hypothetical protein
MPVMWGSVTQSTAEAVTAASTALPPSRSTSTAAKVARGEDVAAMLLAATAGDLPGWSNFLMACLRQNLP